LLAAIEQELDRKYFFPTHAASACHLQERRQARMRPRISRQCGSPARRVRGCRRSYRSRQAPPPRWPAPVVC